LDQHQIKNAQNPISTNTTFDDNDGDDDDFHFRDFFDDDSFFLDVFRRFDRDGNYRQ
jgi:hypothetical protein